MGAASILISGLVLASAVPALAADADDDVSEAVAVFQAQAPNEIASAVVMDSEVTVSDNATARVDSESAHVSTPEGTVSLGVTASTDSVLSEPILMEDGSALVAIVINEPVADTAFRMPLELPDAAAATLEDDGSVLIMNPEGEFYRGIATLESHLADLKADLGTNKSKVTSTIINQFYCHVAYGWLGGGATYNMESWRKDVLWSVQGNPITKCNP